MGLPGADIGGCGSGELNRRIVLKIISRSDAKISGLTRYFTGVPCKNGHIGERRVGCGVCVICNLEAVKKYITANPSKRNALSGKFRKENPEKIRYLKKKYYEENKEKVADANRKYRALNADHLREYSRNYRAANHELIMMRNRNRRARELAAGGTLSKGLSKRLFKLQKGKCACCKKPLGKTYHMDHIVPLVKGGANEDWNIQLLTPRCNSQKHAKDPIEFMRSKGFLL